DVYDALRSRRPYKEPMSHSKARQIIFEGRAKHFDPDVVDAFLLSEAAFEEFSENQSRMGTEANLEATEDIPAECCPV
ncbi:MAG: metal-dependent phosphohydrolase, partial [Planctomycetota bacterium]